MINFPGFGLQFHVSKIVFQIFGVSIYSYAICIVLGILVGIVLLRNEQREIWFEI